MQKGEPDALVIGKMPVTNKGSSRCCRRSPARRSPRQSRSKTFPIRPRPESRALVGWRQVDRARDHRAGRRAFGFRCRPHGRRGARLFRLARPCRSYKPPSPAGRPGQHFSRGYEWAGNEMKNRRRLLAPLGFGNAPAGTAFRGDDRRGRLPSLSRSCQSLCSPGPGSDEPL